MPASRQQAMWVWGAPSVDPLIVFAKAHRVSALFVEVRPSVATDGSLAALQRLKSAADAAHIALYALNGDPSWATDHAAALAWQHAALATGLFAGTHLDVEPYSLPAWQTDQAGTASSFLKLLAALKAASALPLEVDVPFWYGTIAAPAPAAPGATLADAVLAAVDAVTVMSYRNTASGGNSILGVGADMLVRAQVLDKPARLAAETNATPDCGNCSFAGLPASALQGALDEVETAAAGYATFNGMAVEDYAGWSKLGS